MNWLLISVAVLFLICIIVGYVKGFIRFGVSLLATVVTIVIVVFVSPFVGKFLVAVTPLDDMIKNMCMEAMMPSLESIDLTGTPYEGYTVEDIEALGISREELIDLIGQQEIPREMQEKAIEAADIPEVLAQGLINNNNTEVYSLFGVKTFAEYVGAFVSDFVVNIISFLLTFVIVTILIRSILFALDIVTELPVLGGLNRVAGIGVGIAVALIIVWIVFLVVTLLYNFDIGKMLFAQIERSKILSLLYDNNYILKFVTSLK